MPRVYQATCSGRGKSHGCERCGKPIMVGQRFFYWGFFKPMKKTLYQHVACGSVRQSQLTTSKMSTVYAAVETAEDALNALSASDDAPDDIAAVLNDCAGEVEGVKDEYEESLSNMPDSLQQGQTGQDMQEKIDALDEFNTALTDKAGELEGQEYEDDELDAEPEIGSDAREAWEGRRVTWFEGLVSEAQDTLGELSI